MLIQKELQIYSTCQRSGCTETPPVGQKYCCREHSPLGHYIKSSQSGNKFKGQKKLHYLKGTLLQDAMPDIEAGKTVTKEVRQILSRIDHIKEGLPKKRPGDNRTFSSGQDTRIDAAELAMEIEEVKPLAQLLGVSTGMLGQWVIAKRQVLDKLPEGEPQSMPSATQTLKYIKRDTDPIEVLRVYRKLYQNSYKNRIKSSESI